MVRHHYGPWDPRYYDVLGFLEARNLLRVDRQSKTFVFLLTNGGLAIAGQLETDPQFQDLVDQMRRVRKRFGARTGDWLKKLIYRVFDADVARLPKGEVIR